MVSNRLQSPIDSTQRIQIPYKSGVRSLRSQKTEYVCVHRYYIRHIRVMYIYIYVREREREHISSNSLSVILRSSSGELGLS